jgi:hypothetical protein
VALSHAYSLGMSGSAALSNASELKGKKSLGPMYHCSRCQVPAWKVCGNVFACLYLKYRRTASTNSVQYAQHSFAMLDLYWPPPRIALVLRNVVQTATQSFLLRSSECG